MWAPCLALPFLSLSLFACPRRVRPPPLSQRNLARSRLVRSGLRGGLSPRRGPTRQRRAVDPSPVDVENIYPDLTSARVAGCGLASGAGRAEAVGRGCHGHLVVGPRRHEGITGRRSKGVGEFNAPRCPCSDGDGDSVAWITIVR